MSSFTRLRRAHRPSLLLGGLVGALALAGCVAAPELDPGGASRSGGATGPGGGNSTTSGFRDGMVLIPAITVDAEGGIVPMAAGGGGNSDGDDDDKNKKPKGGGSSSGGSSSGGSSSGGSSSGGSSSGGSSSGGSSSGAPAEPAPAPNVAVPAFWLDAREVTAASYRACVDARACTAVAPGAGCTASEGLADHPINCVGADQARVYCKWIGKRLVKSNEWTAAAAGNTRRVYPWGAEPPAANRLNACGIECAPVGMYASSDGHVRTAPVGSFPLGRTPEGVEDLGGNVAEWTESGVLRGSSFEDVDASLAASTNSRAATAASPSVGFRCASDS